MDFPRRRRERTGLELTPLIDVIFQLLVFFLLTANFLRPSLRLELPESATVDEAAREPVRLEIDRDGNVRVDGVAVERSALSEALGRALAGGRSTVRLAGDREMAYGVFVEALDASRRAGAASFDLVHEEAH